MADDHKPHRRIHSVSSLFWLAAIIGLTVSENFVDFVIAEVFAGIAVSLSSGTVSAFIYDTLVELKRQDEFKKVQWNLLFYWFMSVFLSDII